MAKDKTTFIKIDRNILDWRWYKETTTKAVFIHLLLKANIKDNDFMAETIHRGELATSYATLAAETGLTIKQVRTAMQHLKQTGEVEVRGHSRFSIVSIVRYDYYQAQGQAKGHPEGNQRATRGQQSKNDKNDKKDKNINIYIGHDELKPCGKLLYLSDKQLEELAEELGPDLPYYIDRVDDWLQTHPRPKEKHYQTIRTFIANDKKK